MSKTDKTEDLHILISLIFHLLTDRTACLLSYRDGLGAVNEDWSYADGHFNIKEFEMAQLAKDHKAAEGQLHKMEKKDWSVFVLLAIYILHHIATFCIAL